MKNPTELLGPFHLFARFAEGIKAHLSHVDRRGDLFGHRWLPKDAATPLKRLHKRALGS